MTTKIRDQRLRRGLTQRELAAQCTDRGASVSDARLSQIERGMWTPRPRLRAVLAELLDLDVVADFDARREDSTGREAS